MAEIERAEVVTRDTMMEEIAFPITREELLSEDGLHTGKDALIRKDKDLVLGVIPSKKDIVFYPQLVLWLEESLDTLKLPFVMNEHALIRDGSRLYQEYVIQKSLEDTPDGNDLSPMVLLDSSYATGNSIIEFGTFRLVCSNGAKVRETIQSLKMRSVQGSLGSASREDLKDSLLQFAKVALGYKELAEKPFHPIIEMYLLDESISFAFKKAVIEMLISEGQASLGKDLSKKALLDNPMDVFDSVEPIDQWMFYNILTAVATHKAKTISSRSTAYRKISELFGI